MFKNGTLDIKMEEEEHSFESMRQMARWLREAKEAHTAWEASFEGLVPEHDWEVWYAQFIEMKVAHLAGDDIGLTLNITPMPIAKLTAVIGPLE